MAVEKLNGSGRMKVMEMVTTIVASAASGGAMAVAPSPEYYSKVVKTLFPTMLKLVEEGADGPEK